MMSVNGADAARATGRRVRAVVVGCRIAPAVRIASERLPRLVTAAVSGGATEADEA